MAKLTEKAMMAAFLKLLENRSMDKITVKDIIEEVGVNRNTFYYHFEDIYDLIDSIFHEEMKSVASEVSEDSTFESIMERSAQILLDNRAAVRHIYESKSRDVIYKYLDKVTNMFIYILVKRKAEGTDISEEGIKFITYYYSSATISHTLKWIERGMPEYNDDLIRVMATSFDATIEPMIANFVEQEKK